MHRHPVAGDAHGQWSWWMVDAVESGSGSMPPVRPSSLYLIVKHNLQPPTTIAFQFLPRGAGRFFSPRGSMPRVQPSDPRGTR